jgi:hypothetical protein
MLPLCALALVFTSRSVTVSAAPPQTIFVVNANDLGPGSFRHAIDLANTNAAIKRVQFLRKFTVALQHTVYFNGLQDLTIEGLFSTLDAAGAGGDAFVANSAGNLTVSNLTVRKATGEGLEVQVPPGSIGTVRVALFNVAIENNLGHGVLVNDQTDPGDTSNQNGSDASVDVVILGSRFEGNGFSAVDRDGLRVNEGGIGDLSIAIKFSTAKANGADGIEVDERGDGNVRVEMFGSGVHGNGSFTSADFDDGFDIDEQGAGDVLGHVFFSSANDNFEEGFDFNENDGGDLRVDMLLVEASRNSEEGIDFEEDDEVDNTGSGGGDLVTKMDLVKANGNKGGDAGVKIRERGDGSVDATLRNIETSNNLTRGIQVSERHPGNLVSSVTRATSLANTNHGIDFDEENDGDVTAAVADSNASNNGVAAGVAGVRADEANAGGGTATLTNVTLTGNTEPDGTAGSLLP